MRGVSHLGAVVRAAPAIVAWLRWHLNDETDRKAMFTGPSGQFFQGISAPSPRTGELRRAQLRFFCRYVQPGPDCVHSLQSAPTK